jgi:ATP-dependent DNA helicase RecG
MTDPRLVERLQGWGECDWVEWKKGSFEPRRVGRYASALANGARLNGKSSGFLAWGMANDGSVVGTKLKPPTKTVDGQPFEFWLKGRLGPKGHGVRFHELVHDGERVVVLEVDAAESVPVRFEGIPYIRIGSTTPRLEDHPDREKRLQEVLVEKSFETQWARESATVQEVHELLGIRGALTLLGQRPAVDPNEQLEQLQRFRLVEPAGGGLWSITNRAAILFARRLSAFGDRLERRAVRVVFYEGDTRIKTRFEQMGTRGYALGFEGLFTWVESLLPRSEELHGVLRVDTTLYPMDALREIVANALIHQDFSVTGAGPMVEIFDRRVEVSNPGEPLLEIDRLMDGPPRSRNERLARLMRQMNFCEERGSGIDKVVFHAELYQLPPPDFTAKSNGFVATMYAPRTFNEMTPEERIRACYQHACLLTVSGGKPLTNSTLRKRFGLGSERATRISHLIADALDAGVIKPVDPTNRSRAQAAYQPYWA